MSDKICQGPLTRVNRLGSGVMQRDTGNGRRADKWEIRGGEFICVEGRASLCYDVPRLRPVVLLTGIGRK